MNDDEEAGMVNIGDLTDDELQQLRTEVYEEQAARSRREAAPQQVEEAVRAALAVGVPADELQAAIDAGHVPVEPGTLPDTTTSVPQ